MGKLDGILSFGTNLFLHIFILSLFLSVLFFAYISKLTTQHVEHEVDVLIRKEIDKMLTKVGKKDKDKVIRWPIVVSVTNRLKQDYRKELPYVKEHNETLRNNVICFLVIYLFLFVALVIYMKVKKVKIGLKFILVENLIIFTFVGFVELYFFQNIASKYIPVTPDTATNVVITRVKETIGKW